MLLCTDSFASANTNIRQVLSDFCILLVLQAHSGACLPLVLVADAAFLRRKTVLYPSLESPSMDAQSAPSGAIQA